MENFKEGFRFRPTDGEGLTFLLRFIAGQEMNDSGFITTNVDVYGKQEPWEIYSHGVPCGDDDGDNQYRFFITKLKKKNKSKYRRNVANKGSWKQQDVGKPVRYSSSSSVVIGCKKSLSYVNKGYNRKNGHWLMKEYDLSSAILQKFDHDCRDYVLCAIKKSPVIINSCPCDTFTATMSNNVPEETSNNLCRNLEHETTAFLNFQESAHEAVESTSTNDHESLQGVEPYDAGDYMQSNSVPELDALELHQWIKKDLEVIGGVLPDMHDDVNIVVEPLLLSPYTFEATSTLNFDHEYASGLNPWDILLDSDDIDQILQGT